jgi:hypothetical protein
MHWIPCSNTRLDAVLYTFKTCSVAATPGAPWTPQRMLSKWCGDQDSALVSSKVSCVLYNSSQSPPPFRSRDISSVSLYPPWLIPSKPGVWQTWRIFGVSFCQVVVYFRYFPDDSRRLKLVVSDIVKSLQCLTLTGRSQDLDRIVCCTYIRTSLHLNLCASLLDCLHTAGLLGTFWHILVSCHRNASLDCQMTFSW